MAVLRTERPTQALRHRCHELRDHETRETPAGLCFRSPFRHGRLSARCVSDRRFLLCRQGQKRVFKTPQSNGLLDLDLGIVKGTPAPPGRSGHRDRAGTLVGRVPVNGMARTLSEELAAIFGEMPEETSTLHSSDF